MGSITRGIRNNNPGNIRLGQPWQGLSEEQTDGSFCQFTSAEYGIRAIMKLMETYLREGFNTIDKIITRWAPSVENDTKSYIDDVASKAQISADTIIEKSDLHAWVSIIKGIISHENGQNPYDDATIEAGIKLAL